MSKKPRRKPGRKPKTRHIAFRFPNPAVEKLDTFAAQESSRTGYHISRTQALLMLIDRLDDAIVPEPAARSETITGKITDRFEPATTPEKPPQQFSEPEEGKTGWSGWGGQTPQRRKASRKRKGSKR